MDHATDESVRGDFGDARFEYFGIQSRFFRKDGKFMVETDGPDGELAAFEVKYAFGIDPLQQYLIELPGGRLQALSIAWDTRPAGQGGQRWFHLYPDEKIDHGNILHWTRLNQNWNFMCAECHSTGVRRNYDPPADEFKTSFAEISVGCETCHGQGSAHAQWAKAKQSSWPSGKQEDDSLGLLVRFAERLNVDWPIDEKSGNARRSTPPATLRTEVETCGLCHARRGQLSEDWKPGRWLSNTHDVSTLSRGLYHVDGQMQDEVFNYGSFKQSKMFAAGVTCSDCHDPHSSKLRASGDGACQQCHATEKYSAVTHHRHASADPAPSCVSCHMPVQTYMIVDPRHDHSFRVPRPDISIQTGTPNACRMCHSDKTAQWAADAIDAWHGPARKGFQTYAAAFHAAWSGQPDAATLLASVAATPSVPAFARASALGELSAYLSPELLTLARSGFADPDPMVRIGALDMLENAPMQQVWPILSPLLSDPVLSVRIRAAQLLAAVPADQQPQADREAFQKAAQEFIAAQRTNADRPEGRSALGTFYMARGQAAEAEAEFRAALRLNAQYSPAVINLSDLYRLLGRDGDSESLLQQGLLTAPGDAALLHARGLALVRLKRLDEALTELESAAELEPERARYGYVYAVALHSAGRLPDALLALQQALKSSPHDRDVLGALIGFSREAGDNVSALKHAEQLAVAYPNDNALADLILALRREATKSRPPP